MYDYWVVIEKSTGRIIANCGDEKDAIMMVEFNLHNRFYRKQKIILDQIIDIVSTTDKQLPGQLGLPAYKESLSSSKSEKLLQKNDDIIFVDIIFVP